LLTLTFQIFKDVSIAYKRLMQSSDEDWIDQFNSMELFQSVYGEGRQLYSDVKDNVWFSFVWK